MSDIGFKIALQGPLSLLNGYMKIVNYRGAEVHNLLG